MKRSEIGMIAAREIGVRVRAKSFPILTGLLVVLILAIGIVSRFADAGGTEPVAVGVSGDVPDDLAAIVEQTAEGFGIEATVSDVAAASAHQAWRTVTSTSSSWATNAGSCTTATSTRRSRRSSSRPGRAPGSAGR